MTGPLPFGGASVMQQRREPPDSLDFFPTPPWATRALLTHVLARRVIKAHTAWEPAAGEGHMAEVLGEFFSTVITTDVFDYGRGYRVSDFLGDATAGGTDWVITNPPFKAALQFAERAIHEARVGVALLVRSAWLEGTARHEALFKPHPPAFIAQFAERVPMTKGRWDPEASTATSYCWVVWLARPEWDGTRFVWIPPGCRASLTKWDDAARFGVKATGGLEL